MGLHAEHRAAAVDCDWTMIAGCKHPGLRWQLVDLVLATHEQGNGVEGRLHPWLLRTHAELVHANPPAARAPCDPAAQSVRHHLMPKADANKRYARYIDITDELRELVNPGDVIVDRIMRTGGHPGITLGWIGEYARGEVVDAPVAGQPTREHVVVVARQTPVAFVDVIALQQAECHDVMVYAAIPEIDEREAFIQ